MTREGDGVRRREKSEEKRERESRQWRDREKEGVEKVHEGNQ